MLNDERMLSLSQKKTKTPKRKRCIDTLHNTTESKNPARYFVKYTPWHITVTLQPICHDASLGFPILSVNAC